METLNIQNLQKKGHTYSDCLKLQVATSVIPELIGRCKDEYQNYIASRLNDPKANAKMYWSISKTFCNGKKVPIITPLLISLFFLHPSVHPSITIAKFLKLSLT